MLIDAEGWGGGDNSGRMALPQFAKLLYFQSMLNSFCQLKTIRAYDSLNFEEN
jgi:hypothetical protein